MWPGIAHRFLDHNPSLRRCLCRSITGDFGRLVTNPLFLLRMAGDKGRGSMIPSLRLGWRLRAEYKMVNSHLPSGHYICILISLGFYWLNYLGGGIWRFNRHVDFMVIYLGPRSMYDRSGLSTSNV